jgi:hypothetical protein
LHKWEEEKERVIELFRLNIGGCGSSNCLFSIEFHSISSFPVLLFFLKFLREHVFFYTEGLIERFSCCISWSMCICQKYTINANPRTKKATRRKIHQSLTIITNNNWNQQIMRQDVCMVQVIVIIWLLLLR